MWKSLLIGLACLCPVALMAQCPGGHCVKPKVHTDLRTGAISKVGHHGCHGHHWAPCPMDRGGVILPLDRQGGAIILPLADKGHKLAVKKVDSVVSAHGCLSGKCPGCAYDRAAKKEEARKAGVLPAGLSHKHQVKVKKARLYENSNAVDHHKLLPHPSKDKLAHAKPHLEKSKEVKL